MENAERNRLPPLYWLFRFMVGSESETFELFVAEMVETMACSTVPKIVLTINHASGAGYYAMASQGFSASHRLLLRASA
ncbi:MAG: carboxyl transferase domain-containing protein [Bryobacteraceae bacterium]